MKKFFVALVALMVMLAAPAVGNPPPEAQIVDGLKCERVYVKVMNTNDVETDYRVKADISSKDSPLFYRSLGRHFVLDPGAVRVVSFHVKRTDNPNVGVRVSHFGEKFFETTTQPRGCDVPIR